MRNTMICAGTKAALQLTTLCIAIVFAIINPSAIQAQCVAVSGTVEGYVFADNNSNGEKNAEESGISNVLVNAYDQSGALVGFSLTNSSGLFSIGNLPDGKMIRLVFNHSSDFYSSYMGVHNGSSVQFVQVPVCSAALGLLSDGLFCNGETQIVSTCFVQGETDENVDEPTIVGMKYGFNLSSPVTKYASHGETGSIWGIAWKNETKEIFSAAFVKQYAGLTSFGHDAILKTAIGSQPYKTTLFAKLSDLGLDAGKLSSEDIDECNFGEQVGKIGLGALITSPDEQYLYTVNLYNNTLVRINSVVPSAATTTVWQIPDPGCSNGEYRAFALKYHNDKIYVGVTCTGETAKSASASSANVYEFNPEKGTFSLIFTTNYIKGYWYDYPAEGLSQQHWLTDIDFTDEGNMLISLTDRIGHRYCRAETNRLDEQKPDLLIVWNDNGVWKLENNGQAGTLIGSGVGNGQGPGGGEFFGHDFWITNPAYHSEIALGSIFVMPGTGSVVAAVFDPNINAYSGGFHRYTTINGQKEGAIELYTRNTEIAFGKATGFGDVIALCGPPSIEIGNLVWIDKNDNGIQDADESGVAGLTLYLYDQECNLAGSTQTDSKGNYVFNQSNIPGGILPGRKYYLGLDKNLMDTKTGQFLIDGEYYNLAKSKATDVMLDNNGSMTDAPCDMLVFEMITNRNNHNFDLGFAPSGECDLIISMDLLNDNGIRIDEIISLEVTVANRGTALLSDIAIIGKLPEGFQWIPELNPAWVKQNNSVRFVIDGQMASLSSETALIHIKADKSAQYFDFSNTFEITGVSDRNGAAIQDFSFCFAEAGNSKTTKTLPVFDLALMHKLDTEDFFVTGSSVKINTTVFNQGNITATQYTIVNYLNEELDFNPLLNPGWEISQDLTTLKYIEATPLLPGESRTHMIILSIKEDIEVNQIINYAEIASSTGEGGYKDVDFDSTPDDDPKNDIGGEVGRSTDNMVSDHGVVDEDDHDPVLIQIESVDISLVKTTPHRRVKAGQEVVFYIDITNEGSVTLNNVKIIDYIPAKLILNDSKWTKVGNNAELIVSFPEGLKNGQTHRESIHFIVAENATPALLINAAEVVEYTDENGRIISEFDADSFADNIRGNDAFNPNDKGNREDDYDEAFLFIIETSISTRCLNNASNLIDGQCESFIEILSGSDETWFIEQVVGFYLPSSLTPPVDPDPYLNGFELNEDLRDEGISAYTISGKFVSAQGFSLRLRNNFGDLEDFIINQGCIYTPVIVSGPRSLCTGGLATYSIPAIPDVDYYVWTVNDVLTGSNSNTITINWNDYGPGTHNIKVELEFFGDEVTACYTPGLATVVVGAADLSAIACIGDFNVSLNGNCELFVTPAMLIAGSFSSSSPYIVMLTDKNGKPIPDARLTQEHVGTKVMAKLIEGCGGNSCWSTITVEDKIAPVSLCQSITLPCYKLDEYKGPFESDNCGGHVENKLISETISLVDCSSGPSPFIKYIDRIYQAVDESGNLSSLCSMRISVERPDFGLIVWPDNYTMMNGNVLVCDLFEKDENGMPSTKVTGVPTIAGLPLYPYFSEVCNLYTGYTDKDLGKIGCVRKIRRTWMVYEQWCSSGNLRYYDQMLEITDNLAPVIEPIADLNVSASIGACMARVNLPVPVVTDECVGVLEVDVTYPGGFFKNQYGGLIDVPVGVHTITYTAYDECRNSSSRTFKITVEDKTPPVVICKGETVASLNVLGEAYMFPHHINDGSYDACGIDSMRIARMDDAINGEIPNHLFGKSVSFDCDDAGKRIMVALKVWDTSGNSNTCMVTVEVQDKFPPQITCPPHATIFCDEDINLNNLTQYGTATAIDACGAEVTELPATSTLNACRVGKIERTFRATDNLGSATCKQQITVSTREPFNPYTDVIKSEDFEVTDKCSKDDLLPENLEGLKGYPVINRGKCHLVASSYSDQVFTIVTGACYKIVRTWTIIDWCAMDTDPEYEPFVFQQTIAVKNTVPPFFTSLNRDTTICTAPGNCESGLVILNATGGDLCTPANQLRWKYIIFIDNNQDNKITDSGLGANMNINMLIKTGSHRIQWVFEDACGNLVVKDQMITVVNCDGPKPVSLQRIAVGLVPWDTDGDGVPDIEKACIYASSINASSYHPCGLPIRFSFSPDVNDTIRCYNCFDVGIVIDTLWVTDSIGRQDYTTFVVDVQDNNDSDVCENICVINAPEVEITGGDNSCSGDPVTLTASGGVGYLWNTGATTASITVSPLISTTYTVTVTGEIGCTASAERIVNVRQRPVVTISGENICNGVNTTLSASGAVSYIWNTGATTSSITVSPPISTTYSVTATGANGCTAVATRTVGVSSVPNAQIAGPISTCPAVPVTITASGGASYEWSTGQTTASITVAPVVNTTYIVTVTDENGCTATASRTISILALPEVSITGDNEICIGESTTLIASGAVSYAWSNGQNTPSILVNPIVTTSYVVTATAANGCTATSSRTVTVNGLPNAGISGFAEICLGQSTTLTASGGTAYLWSNGVTTASITVSPVVNTTYIVTVTDANSCSNTATINVVVRPLPDAQVTGINQICPGTSTTLTALGGVSYVWSTGAVTSAIIVSPIVQTTYIVTVTDANGCTATASRTVSIFTAPTAVITGEGDICEGESIDLVASGGVSYVWNTGATTAQITVSPLVTTVYTVTVTDNNGCTASSTATVTINSAELVCETQDITVYLNALGQVSITPDDISIGNGNCGDNISLTVTPNQFFCNDAAVGERIVTLTVTNTLTSEFINCQATVTVLDTIRPILICPADATVSCLDYNPNAPLSDFGQATFSDNCPAGLLVNEIPIINLNTCNAGAITRTFVATDVSQNTAQCVQLITIQGVNPIDINDITFPPDITINSCTNTSPEFTGGTVVNLDGADCADVVISFSDIEIHPVCKDTIFRTWTVVDSCQLIPGTLSGIFSKTQVIVVDLGAPVILGPLDTLIDVGLVDCLAELQGLFHSAVGCTIEIDNNSGNNPGTFDVSGIYPVGTTTVILTAVEICNDLTTTFEFDITVLGAGDGNLDCHKTFPVINDQGIAVDNVNDHAIIDVECGENVIIIPSFSKTDVNDSLRFYTCDQVFQDIPIVIYFWMGNMVIDSCNSLVTPFDEEGNNFCSGNKPVLRGQILTELNQPVKNVEIHLEGSDMPAYMSDAQGRYNFGEMESGGTYDIIPAKDINPLEGVSTLDLVLIQRHVLGLDKLNSPYKLIAADINNDGRISAADIVQLRKLLLGVVDRFPDNTSWQMVDKAYAFPVPEDPFITPYPETYHIEALNSSMKVDFVGVKTGDVNNSYTPNIISAQNEQRTVSMSLLSINDKTIGAAPQEVPVYAAHDAGISGLQMVFSLADVADVQIEAGALNVEPLHYHFENGFLFVVWSNTHEMKVAKGDELFTIRFTNLKSGKLSDKISLEKSLRNPEWYDGSLEVRNVNIHWGKTSAEDEAFELIGNTPNPWNNETLIHFFVPSKGQVQLKLRDMTGKLILERKQIFEKGKHQISLLSSDIPVAGLLFYELQFNDQVRTMKMLNIR